ncbi:hypothetical protein MHU86_16738 [Fragilaria crotonensis]|nr:hypothetical protein MHU86_16738 [Fragilaria crotonensis]
MDVKVKVDETNDEEAEELCPLFMDGLPKDFSTNVHLAALASLMNDEVVENDDGDDESKQKPKSVASNGTTQSITTKKGGGKVDRRSQVRNKRQGVPYSKPTTTKTPAASLGEAQLFLKMWSLK